MGIYVMDVLVKGEWQEVPMGTTVGSVGVMNNPSPNRLRTEAVTSVSRTTQTRIRAQRQSQLAGS